LLHTSNTVFLKCGPPFWFLAPLLLYPGDGPVRMPGNRLLLRLLYSELVGGGEVNYFTVNYFTVNYFTLNYFTVNPCGRRSVRGQKKRFNDGINRTKNLFWRQWLCKLFETLG